MFNVTFNNISVASWLSVFLVEEARVPRENLPQEMCIWSIRDIQNNNIFVTTLNIYSYKNVSF